MSGRSPRTGEEGGPPQDTTLHAYNNVWENCDGIAFELEQGAKVVAKNNVFTNVLTPVKMTNAAKLYTVRHHEIMTNHSPETS